jgi:hypothetical protein
LVVALADGREISTPLAWYPALLAATEADRDNLSITPFGLHWPALDEDLSLNGMMAGRPAFARKSTRPKEYAGSDFTADATQKWSFARGNIVVDDDVPTDVLDQLHDELASPRDRS